MASMSQRNPLCRTWLRSKDTGRGISVRYDHRRQRVGLCVGPPRAGHFGLRAHVEETDARNAVARDGRANGNMVASFTVE